MIGKAYSTVIPRAAKQVSVRSIFSSAAASSQPNLELILPGTPNTIPSTGPKPETKVSTLSNGVKVASEEGHGSVVKVGIVVKAGSRFESVPGTSHVLKKHAFKATTSRSDIRLYRDLESIGATVAATGGRELISYSITSLPEFASQAVSILGESVVSPKLPHYEVSSVASSTVASEVEDFHANTEALITEALHAAAYRDNSPLGHNYFAQESGAITSDVLQAFHQKQFNASNLVITGVGIKHETLVNLAESAFANLAQGSTSTAPNSPYKGGEVRVPSAPGTTVIGAALGIPGDSPKDKATLAVLKELLDASTPFSTFSASYTGSGLLGVYGSVSANKAATLAGGLVSALKKLSNASPEQISAAKNRVKYTLAAKADCRNGAFDQIGQSVLLLGSKPALSQLISTVDSVTGADLGKIVLSASSNISLASIGDLSRAPYLDEITA